MAATGLVLADIFSSFYLPFFSFLSHSATSNIDFYIYFEEVLFNGMNNFLFSGVLIENEAEDGDT